MRLVGKSAIGAIFGTIFLITLIQTPFFVSASTISEDTFDTPSNDTFALASMIGEGKYTNLAQYDDDWYQIYGDLSWTLYVEIYFNSSSSNLDLYIFDQFGYLSSSSKSVNSDFESCSFNTGAMAQYIHILVNGTNSGENYTLNVRKTYSFDDMYETNNDLNSAKNLNRFNSYNSLCMADTDYYAFQVNPYEIAQFSLNFAVANFECFNVEYYNYNSIFDSQTDYTGQFTHTFPIVPYSWVLKVRINGTLRGMPQNYSIWTNFMQDDSFEENDIFTNPKTLTSGNYQNLTQRDNDFYRVVLNTQQSLNFGVTSYTYADLFVRLVDKGNNNTINTDYSTIDGFVNLSVTIDVGYTYQEFIFLVGGGNYGTTYNLSIFISNQDDEFEQNDIQADSKQLTKMTTESLKQFDEDWFWFNSESNACRYIVTLSFGDNPNPMTMTIQLVNGNGIDHATATANGNLIWTFNTTSTIPKYFIKISGDNTGKSYNLTVFSITNCNQDDFFENNDNIGEASYLNQYNSTIFPLLRQFDDDYYRYTGISGLKITIQVNSTKIGSTLKLEVLIVNAQYMNVQASDYSSSDGLLSVNYEFSADGDLYFRILGDNTGESYTLTIKNADGTSSNDESLENPFGEIPGYPIEFMFLGILLFVPIVTKRIRKIQKH